MLTQEIQWYFLPETQTCQTAYDLKCDFAGWKKEFSINYVTQEEDDRRHLIFCGNCSLVMT